MSFLGLGATAGDDDSSCTSVIHQDSDEGEAADDDEDVLRDDDEDLGFRRHHYETFENGPPRQRRMSRHESKEDALYGVFRESNGTSTTTSRRTAPTSAPLFVRATQTPKESSPPSTTTETPMMFVAANSQGNEEIMNEREQDTKRLSKDSEPVPRSLELPPEETAEEMESNKAQKTADEYFQSLLRQAQSKRQSRREQQQQQQQADAERQALPMDFGSANDAPTMQNVPVKKKDPTIAKWEKHEKGIGSKLLFKMGWKGSGGLGSNRRKSKPTLGNAAAPTLPATDDTSSKVDPTVGTPAFVRTGISQPIEVVVRPANLGLGFGSFKEQSQLKANRKIEAAVRGVELSETKKKNKKRGVLDFDEDHGTYEDEGDDDTKPSTRSSSSAIPTTQELMTQKAWKRRKTKRVAPKIVPYEELVKSHEQTQSEGLVIIDMRGPSTSYARTAEGNKTDGEVPLGEELLHNVTFMLNTHENQLHSQAQMIKSISRKETSLQSEILDLERQQQEARDRRQKLEETLLVVQRVEDLANQPWSENSKQMEQVIEWIQELATSFSTEDRNALHFWQALAPALLSPILHVRLEQWDPLGSIDATQELLHGLFHIRIKESNAEDREAVDELRFSILQSQLVPRVQQVLESSRWDPCTETDVVLDMYEYMISSASTLVTKKVSDATTYSDDQLLFGGAPDDNHIEKFKDAPAFAEIIRKQLVLETIFPKLQSALSHWKPSLSKVGSSLENRLDMWILPWIPHLDHPVIFSDLLSECKRKLKSSLSYLQRKIGKDSDIGFVQSCFEVLKPWARVFDSKQLQSMVSEYVTPYLARALAKQNIQQNATAQDWKSVLMSFDLHGTGLLSDIEFLSLFEAELLPRWASKLGDMLISQRMSAMEAAAMYMEWKAHIMLHNETQTHGRCQELLRDDNVACGIFFMVLRMIEKATHFNMDKVAALQPPQTNYYVAAARRNKLLQGELQDDFVRMESRSKIEIDARIRLRRRQVDTPTFRDVVEEFALERGILFQPRMGAKALKDGKHVFLFGSVPIYIEGDVIYASQRGVDWRPTSLEQLMDSAAASDS